MKPQLALLTIVFWLNLQNAASQNIPLAKSIDTTHRSVVAIIRVNSEGKSFVAASGVLIYPNVVLTAGHVNFSVVKFWDSNPSPIGFVSFGNNVNASQERIPFNWLKDVVTHPDQTEVFKSYSDTTGKSSPTKYIDIGLIFLDRQKTDMPLAHLPDSQILSTISKYDHLVGVGYGYDKEDSIYQRIPGLIDGLRRKWQLSQISLVNDLWLKTGCDLDTNLPFIGMFDSGAPLLLNDNMVVGIWVSTDKAPKPCLFSSLAVRIDNPRVLKWIHDQINVRLDTKSK
jgi:hypothetical protein